MSTYSQPRRRMRRNVGLAVGDAGVGGGHRYRPLSARARAVAQSVDHATRGDAERVAGPAFVGLRLRGGRVPGPCPPRRAVRAGILQRSATERGGPSAPPFRACTDRRAEERSYMSDSLTGAEFKAALRNNTPKMGLFINSHSPTAVEQLAHSGYDWLLIDLAARPDGVRDAVHDGRGHRQRRREVAGAGDRLRRPRGHPAGPGRGVRRRARALHQQRRRGPARR